MAEEEDEDEKPLGPHFRESGNGITFSGDVKRRIVTEFAQFRTSVEIRRMLADEYGIKDVTIDKILRYDPTRPYSALGVNLRKLYDEARKAYVEGTADLAIAQQAYRLRQLERLIGMAMERKQIKLAAELLEQASKEVGGMFTNTRKVEGSVEHRHMTVDEARAKIEKMQARLRDGEPAPTIQ
jgi:hypothetical protein